ncbi:hypothetical protein [Marinobacter sp. OP 3.4]|uniref:hypothetical protein n=1 Tax=Marinobacter sp. OP 3.4 TaxID=3076501 RepID=UPI002E1DB429
MTDKQFKAIVGLISGLETAVVVLADAMQKQGAIKDVEGVADVFEQQIQALPDDQEMVELVLKHVVSGLRHADHDPSTEISRVLH